MKSRFKLLMIKLEKFQKEFMIIKIQDQLKLQNQHDVYAIRE